MIQYFESHPLSASSFAEIAIPLDISSTTCTRFSRLNLQELVKFTHYAPAQKNVEKTTQFWTSIFSSCPSLKKVGCSISAALTWPRNQRRVELSEIVLGFSGGEEETDSSDLRKRIVEYVCYQEKQDEIHQIKQHLDLGIHLGDESLAFSRFSFVKSLVTRLDKVLDFEVLLLIPRTDNNLIHEVELFENDYHFVDSIFQKYKNEADFQRIWDNLRVYRLEDEADWGYDDRDYYTDPDDYHFYFD